MIAAVGWTVCGYFAGMCSTLLVVIFVAGIRRDPAEADEADPELGASIARHPSGKPATLVIVADRAIAAKALGTAGMALVVTSVDRRSVIVRFPTAERAFDVGTRLADEASSMLPPGWNVTPLFDQVDEPASRISFGLDFTNRGTPRNSS